MPDREKKEHYPSPVEDPDGALERHQAEAFMKKYQDTKAVMYLLPEPGNTELANSLTLYRPSFVMMLIGLISTTAGYSDMHPEAVMERLEKEWRETQNGE